MKNFYQKMFANYSPFLLIFMILVLIGGYSIRTQVAIPLSSISQHAEFLNKFSVPTSLVTSNPDLFFKIELILSVAVLVLAFFLGKLIAGKTEGLFIAVFMGFYPYFVANCYSTSIFFIIFFILYLIFQLKASTTFLKKWSTLSGFFFMLSVIMNPICIFLGLVPYIYYMIKSKNIAVLYNFLFFLLGALIALSPFMLYVLLNNKTFSYIIPFSNTFSAFGKNFGLFVSSPLNYFINSMIPFFTDTIAKPNYYVSLNSYSYLHYVIITLSALGILYAFIEEKIRVIFLIFLVILIQALFMPVNFGFLFMFLIFMASYMVDKVFHDVFC